MLRLLIILNLTPLILSQCIPGEYNLDKMNVCWPCEPGFQCDGTNKTSCKAGQWSGRGEAVCKECGKCGPGLLQVRGCDAVGDCVCTLCPVGFGCEEGGVVMCSSGTFSMGVSFILFYFISL